MSVRWAAGVNAYVTRDSVSAAEDVDAPHGHRFHLPDAWSWADLVHRVWRASTLPKIAGGHATWALSSGIPLAVAAQEWDQPTVLFRLDSDRKALDIDINELRLHWSYFDQTDPELVLKLLRRLRLTAVPAPKAP